MFGSDAYAHVPRYESAKFDSKTRKCIMVGYGNVTKGYRLYDATQEKIFHSPDVQFNEQVKHQSEGAQVKSDYQLIADLIADFSEAPEADTGGYDNYLNISRSHLLQNHQGQREYESSLTTMAKKVATCASFPNRQYPTRKLLQGLTRENGSLLWKRR